MFVFSLRYNIHYIVRTEKNKRTGLKPQINIYQPLSQLKYAAYNTLLSNNWLVQFPRLVTFMFNNSFNRFIKFSLRKTSKRWIIEIENHATTTTRKRFLFKMLHPHNCFNIKATSIYKRYCRYIGSITCQLPPVLSAWC